MPFQSKAQARWMFAAQSRGELPKGTANRWAAHTKNIKKLPQHAETMDSEKCAELLRQVLDSTDSGPFSTVPSPTLASAGPLFDRAFQNLLRPVLESKTAAFAPNTTPAPPALTQPVQGQNLSAYLPYITSLPSATNKPVNVPQITLPTQPQAQPQPPQPSAATPAPGNKAPNLPGTPGHAATNVIDRMGPLDPSGQTVDGNNAANARGMGAGTKMAKLKAKSALAMTAPPIADEDDTAYPGKTPNIPLMRGWQWKALQQSADEGFSNWMPRIFQTPETPLTELLASPAKQSLLQGALGALLGGGAGALAGAVPGSEAVGGSPVLSVGGGLVGGLLGALRGYKSRREENDRIIDALRRTPPGAVLRDWDALRQQDEAAANQAQKQAEQRVMTKIAAEPWSPTQPPVGDAVPPNPYDVPFHPYDNPVSPAGTTVFGRGWPNRRESGNVVDLREQVSSEDHISPNSWSYPPRTPSRRDAWLQEVMAPPVLNPEVAHVDSLQRALPLPPANPKSPVDPEGRQWDHRASHGRAVLPQGGPTGVGRGGNVVATRPSPRLSSLDATDANFDMQPANAPAPLLPRQAPVTVPRPPAPPAPPALGEWQRPVLGPPPASQSPTGFAGLRPKLSHLYKLAVVPNPNLVAALQEEQAKQQQALASQQPQQAMPPGSSMPPPGGDPAAQGQAPPPPPQPQGQPAQDLIRMSQEARGAPRVPIPPGQPVA
jgi:hypothetical protein